MGNKKIKLDLETTALLPQYYGVSAVAYWFYEQVNVFCEKMEYLILAKAYDILCLGKS